MTELDFDELDKAVNSLMADVSVTKKEANKDDTETVLDLDAPSSDTSVATADALDLAVVADVSPATDEPLAVVPAAEPVLNDTAVEEPTAAVAEPVVPVVSAPAKPTSLAAKRRGQFMDMIHPSADMKAPAVPAPRREGVTIQPVAARNTSPAVDVVAPSNESDNTTPDSEVANAEQSAWPDPIDMVSEKESTFAESEVNNEPVVASTEPEPVADDLPELIEPLSSPFLANTKVDKRPLGTNSQASDVATDDEPTPTDTDTEADDIQVAPSSSIPQNSALPAELHTDIMALESSNTTETTEEAKEPAAAEIQSEDTVTTDAPVVAVAAAASAPSTSAAGNGSIPQQYKEQASSGDAINTAIYDTSTHHQPLDVTEHKKHSPIKWIIIGLVILIIGAVAGAAYFYFTTNT